MHELDLCIEWIITRDTKSDTSLFGGFYLLKSEKLVSTLPQLLILYHYNSQENKVTLIAVKEVK